MGRRMAQFCYCFDGQFCWRRVASTTLGSSRGRRCTNGSRPRTSASAVLTELRSPCARLTVCCDAKIDFIGQRMGVRAPRRRASCRAGFQPTNAAAADGNGVTVRACELDNAVVARRFSPETKSMLTMWLRWTRTKRLPSRRDSTSPMARGEHLRGAVENIAGAHWRGPRRCRRRQRTASSLPARRADGAPAAAAGRLPLRAARGPSRPTSAPTLTIAPSMRETGNADGDRPRSAAAAPPRLQWRSRRAEPNDPAPGRAGKCRTPRRPRSQPRSPAGRSTARCAEGEADVRKSVNPAIAV